MAIILTAVSGLGFVLAILLFALGGSIYGWCVFDFASFERKRAVREHWRGGMANALVKVGNTVAADDPQALTLAQFGQLAEVLPELEWLANITNPKSREVYRIDVGEFSAFAAPKFLCSPGARAPARLCSPFFVTV